MERIQPPFSPVTNIAEQRSRGELSELERLYPEGVTTQQVVEILAGRGQRLTEATFRKYVQLGLLPRSVRTGRKGKHKGSQGLYPHSVVRQLEMIRRLMSQGLTIEEIQNDFPFLGGGIDDLHRNLNRLLSGIEQVTARAPKPGTTDQVLRKAVLEARAAGEELIEKLRQIEERLVMRARMARAVV
jgi:DNA-binding transcriptional MerR regulator